MEWRARPLTLRLYVGVSLTLLVLSIVLDPGQLSSPWILLTLVSLVLMKMLWDGSAGVWWLSVLTYGASAAASLSTLSERPSAGTELALSVIVLMLLVHSSTRAWFNRRIAERFP